MLRVNHTEINCGNDGKYSRIVDFPKASAPAGFWAEATITDANGKTRTEDVTPEGWEELPVSTQTDY